MGNCASEPKTDDFASPAPVLKKEEERDELVNTGLGNEDKQPSLGALLMEEEEKAAPVLSKPKETEVVIEPKETKVVAEQKEEKEEEKPKTTTEKKEEIGVEQVKAPEAEIVSVLAATVTQEDKKFDEEKKLAEDINDIKKPAEVIDDIKKPAEVIDDIKNPAEVIDDIKKPAEEIDDIKKPA
ncbi:hypothetical protein ABKV19_013911 [Rosa sericea]